MGLLDDLKSLFKREASEAKRWIRKSVGDANRALDNAERRAAADPDERMRDTLDDIEANEQSFDEVRARAESASARAEADSELVESEVVEVQTDTSDDEDFVEPAVTDPPLPEGEDPPPDPSRSDRA